MTKHIYTDLIEENKKINWKKLGLLDYINNEKIESRISEYFDQAFECFLSIESDIESPIKSEQTSTVVFPMIRRIFGNYDNRVPEIKDLDILDLIHRTDLAFQLVYPEYLKIFGNHNDPEAEFVAHLAEMFQLEYIIKD